MISAIDPELRLHLLKKYMAFWVDNYPDCRNSFENYLHFKYPRLIPGTVPHSKLVATHCYYCGRKFSDKPKMFSTIDHWLPQSKGESDKFIICCSQCNSAKANLHPHEFVRRITIATMNGLPFMGFQGKKLLFVRKQVEKIFYDDVSGSENKIYYIKQ